MQRQSCGGRRKYRNKCPATDNGSKQLTTTNVDIPRTERHEVVRSADRVGRDVDTERDDDETNGGKGG